VGLQLQQQPHIKIALPAWQARQVDVIMSARLVMHTLHKGLQLLQLNSPLADDTGSEPDLPIAR